MQIQTNETVKELKSRQNFENRVKELQKQLDTRAKEFENISIQYNNVKEQVKLLESTTNEQKVKKNLTKVEKLYLQ